MNRESPRVFLVTAVLLMAHAVPECAEAPRPAEWKGLPRPARSAADSIMTVVARATRLTPRASRGEVNAIYLDCHREAARFELRWRSDRGIPDPFAVIDRELPRMGWTLDVGNRADGTDGMVYAFTRGKLLCVVEGMWDGGDGTDTTQVLSPWKSVLLDVASRKRCPRKSGIED
jgi:hypothetical protein